MPIITISRQYASGGANIAALVAKSLGWDLVDNAFVDRVAALGGMPPEEVARLEERVARFVEGLGRGGGGAGRPACVPRGVGRAVGRGCVVRVGRGAQAYLGNREGTLHVYVVAPRDVRIKRAAERNRVDVAEAERLVDGTDNNRRRDG